MTDLIAHALACLCSLLFPARGKHRAALAPVPAPAPTVRPRRPLPPHKSPYAREAAERRPFVEHDKPRAPLRPHAGATAPGEPRAAGAGRTALGA